MHIEYTVGRVVLHTKSSIGLQQLYNSVSKNSQCVPSYKSSQNLLVTFSFHQSDVSETHRRLNKECGKHAIVPLKDVVYGQPYQDFVLENVMPFAPLAVQERIQINDGDAFLMRAVELVVCRLSFADTVDLIVGYGLEEGILLGFGKTALYIRAAVDGFA